MDDALTIRLADTESITSYSPIVSKDKRFLLCCSGCDVKVYSIRSGQCVHVLRGHQDLVTSVLFNPANQFQVLSSSLDGTIKRWNFEDGVLINTTTPRCLDSSTPLAVCGMYDLPNDKKHFIYLIKTSGGDNSEEKGGYRFLKQTVQMETWSTADFISTRTMKKLPSHVSIGGKGSFLAAIISANEFDVFNLLKGGNSLRHRVSNDSNVVEVMQCLAKPTCLAAHPSEDCVAVGHADGKINIWSNVLSKKAKHSWVAWHALPVLSLKFTPEGSYLLSGGHESVLVKWCHGAYGNPAQREYLPRLGAPVAHINSSEDNSVYVTSHLDNSIKVVRNWIVVQIFQGLTRDHLSAGKDAFVAGVNFEPRSGALVLNGLPGHLQFYSLNEDTLLYNLDIVGQNYTSGDSLAHQHNYTRIELVDFTADGSWMVTVERWSGSYSEQCRMKLWFYDTETSSYVLNTDIDRPHQGGVASVRFSMCASEDDFQTIMLVSVGSADRKFKLWRITDSQSDGRKSGSSWRMESTGYYKNKNCLSVEFSDDGSILAVVFANSLTLWDPFENQLCTAFDLKSDIKSAKFCHGAQANYIAIATENDVILWDLLAYSEKHKWEGVSCKLLVVDPLSDFFLGFSANAGYIFSCSGDMKSIDFPSYARNITTAAFTTNKQATTAPHSVKRRVYLSSSTGSLLVVDDKDVAHRPDVTPTVEEASKNRLAKNYQQLTPLANLLAGNLVQQNRDSKAQIDSRRGLAATQLVQQIGETSCVAMPSINTLCRAFIHSLLMDTLPKSKRKQDEDSESEMEVESSDSENEESVPRKPLVDDVSNAPQETAGRRLHKSDVLDFRNAWQKIK